LDNLIVGIDTTLIFLFAKVMVGWIRGTYTILR